MVQVPARRRVPARCAITTEGLRDAGARTGNCGWLSKDAVICHWTGLARDTAGELDRSTRALRDQVDRDQGPRGVLMRRGEIDGSLQWLVDSGVVIVADPTFRRGQVGSRCCQRDLRRQARIQPSSSGRVRAGPAGERHNHLLGIRPRRAASDDPSAERWGQTNTPTAPGEAADTGPALEVGANEPLSQPVQWPAAGTELMARPATP